MLTSQRFILPRLHLDDLGAKKNKRAVKLALQNLTRDLGPIYNSAKARILAQEDQDIDIAKRTLSWIFYASRPLGIEEIQHALAVEPEQRDFDEECLIREEDIVSVCASLVSIDPEGKTIHFVHQTVQEYLESDHSGLLLTTQDHIAKTCITYLRFNVFAIENEEWDRRARILSSRYPFLFYAAQYWGYHASQCPGHNMETVVLDFLDRAPQLAQFVMHNLKYQYGADGRRSATDAPKLQIAASFGLKDVVRYLLKSGADIDAKSTDGWTALSAAAWNGEQGVVELLLENGADKEAKNHSGWNALANACRNEHLGIIRTLLAGGADIETRTDTGWTPLLSAAWHGHISVIRLLLENGADIEANNNSGWTSLHQAAGHSDSSAIQLLLDSRSSVDARSDWGWTPLMGAAISKRPGAISAVKLLLQAGSDRAARDTRGETAYDKATMHGNTEIANLLM